MCELGLDGGIVGILNSSAGHVLEGQASPIVVAMQITEHIGGYAKYGAALTAAWGERHGMPLVISGAVGGDERRPAGTQHDDRFGKVWIMRTLMDRIRTEEQPIEWILWMDADVYILRQAEDWASALIRTHGSFDLIATDQRDSQFGDMNAGVMLLRVSDWTDSFLEAWWHHEEALEGVYEQR